MNEKESAHFARNDSEARGGGLESRRGHDPSKLRINVSCPYMHTAGGARDISWYDKGRDAGASVA